jgi:hypothetical protein
MLMRPKHPLDRLLTVKASVVHHLMGSFTAQPAEEMPSDVERPAAGPVTSVLFLRYRLQSFKVGADILNHDEMIIVIQRRTRSLTADSFSNQRLERIWAKLFDLSQRLSASEPA